MKRELSAPPATDRAREAVEVFRAWIVDGRLECVLAPAVFRDHPEMWGLVFADGIQHVTNAVNGLTGRPRAEIRLQIRDILLKELAGPTDQATGEFGA